MPGKTLVVIVVVLFAASAAYADLLKLKSGEILQGTLVNANSSEVQFKAVAGGPKKYRVADVDGIDFAALPEPPPAVAPPAAKARAVSPAIVIPAGTEITVRLIDGIQGSATNAGQRYNASIDDPVVVGTQVALPRGANCTVQVVALEGGKEVDLKLYDVSLGGKTYATASDYAVVKAEGTSKGRKAVRRGVGLGAIGAGIGAIAGGGSGAAIGAAVGGGVGAVSAAAAKGKQINVPSETRLAFKLKSALPLN